MGMLFDGQATVVMEGIWHANVGKGGLFGEHEAEGSVPGTGRTAAAI
jgi:hypothetical protein